MSSTSDPKKQSASSTVPSVVYSVAMAALGASAIGTTVYIAAKSADVLSNPLLYHALLFGLFFGIYMVMPGGFEANFNIPQTNKKMTIADVIYYTMVVHSTAGFGDIYPLTFYARACVSAHLGFVFLGTANLIKLGGNNA